MPAAGQDKDYRVYRAPETIRIERYCVDAEAYGVQAYAELESEDGRARALVLAYAYRDDIFVGLRLVALRLKEGEGAAGYRGRYPYNWSPEVKSMAAQLELSDAHREVALALVLMELDSGEDIRLLGPTLWVPDRIWHERPSKPKTLGLFAALNPFEEGGVWQWPARGIKNGGCIKERRAAKRRFAAP